MAHFQVVAFLRVKPEAIEVARPHIAKLVEATRKEPGCVKYDWYQDAKEPGTFVVLETYANAEAFEAHVKNPHFLEIIEQSKEWVSAPTEIRILKPEFVQ